MACDQARTPATMLTHESVKSGNSAASARGPPISEHSSIQPSLIHVSTSLSDPHHEEPLTFVLSLAEQHPSFQEQKGFLAQTQVEHGTYACLSISVFLAIEYQYGDLKTRLSGDREERKRNKLLDTMIRAGVSLDTVIQGLLREPASMNRVMTSVPDVSHLISNNTTNVLIMLIRFNGYLVIMRLGFN